ncbi:MAG: rhodanese-like domain-containing protein [Thermoanaerobaculia bacterium]
MGPFVPDLISDQLNLVVALALGFLFGFVLEQAGFSSSRRLVGVFYGYDLTVLRVFFTAAVTAAVGVLLLAAGGLLDLTAIFVNPTWLYPAIVGGVLMGLGFLFGGFCPGTSVCAVAIGKVDAMAFVGGSFLGIFGYAELFPRFAAFADSTSLGPAKVYESLKVSPGLFVLLLAGAAVLAFVAGGIVERKVAPGTAPSRLFPVRKHVVAGALLLAVAALAAVLPSRNDRLVAKVNAPGYVPHHAVRPMTPDELAFRILDRDPHLRVVDLRPETARKAHPLPGTIAVPAGDVLGREWRSTFSQRLVKKVLVGGTEAEAKTAAFLLVETGFENVAYLEGGWPEFERTVLSPVPPEGEGRFAPVVERFREQARIALAERVRLEQAAGKAAPKKVKKVQGGC